MSHRSGQVWPANIHQLTPLSQKNIKFFSGKAQNHPSSFTSMDGTPLPHSITPWHSPVHLYSLIIT